MKRILTTGFMIAWQLAVVFSQTKADDVTGFYLTFDPKTNDKAQLEIYRAGGGTYEAKVVWVENKAVSHEVGTIQIRNLTYDPKSKEWKNGKVKYDGSEYSMNVSFTDDGRLKARGFLGISLLGKTQYWTKEKEARK